MIKPSTGLESLLNVVEMGVNDTNIETSRRSFLKVPVRSLLILPLLKFLSCQESYAGQDLMLVNGNVDSKMIKEVVSEEKFPYINKITHDKNLVYIKKVMEEYKARLIKDPLFEQYLIKMLNHPSLKNSPLSRRAKRYLSSSRRQEIVEGAADTMFDLDTDRIRKEGDLAYTVQYPFDFGKGLKSDVYFFDSGYNGAFQIQTKKGVVEITLKDVVAFILRHEGLHGESNYKGIHLGDGLFIDNSSFNQIPMPVSSFVDEAETHIRRVEIYNSDRYSPGYMLNASRLEYYYTIAFNEIKGLKLSPYESRLVNHQSKRLKESVLEVKNFLKSIGAKAYKK